jgi:hypothetical protein
MNTTMKAEFVDAVTKLVDAVLYAECTPAGGEDGLAVEVTVNAVLGVLKEIRAAPELSSLHEWADRQLSVQTDTA